MQRGIENKQTFTKSNATGSLCGNKTNRCHLCLNTRRNLELSSSHEPSSDAHTQSFAWNLSTRTSVAALCRGESGHTSGSGRAREQRRGVGDGRGGFSCVEAGRERRDDFSLAVRFRVQIDERDASAESSHSRLVR